MNRRLAVALVSLAAAFLTTEATPARASSPTPDAIVRHVRKAFSLSPLWEVKVSNLKPAAMPGFLAGTLTIQAPQGSQAQPLLASADGKWYFVGAAYALEPSPISGFKTLKANTDSPPPPDLSVSSDGRFAILGTPQNLDIDPDADRVSKMKLTGVPFAGPADAPLTLVEYSDMQCPHCKRAHDILKENLGAYKGKVRRIFKNYPLTNLHPWAYRAALGLACAGKLSPASVPAFESGVFDRQEDISAATANKPPTIVAAEADKALKAIAAKTGLAAEKFARCLEGPEAKSLVEADIAEGDRVGVSGTPSIFINGRKTRGYEWPEVKAVLDAMSLR
ncbi:MAG: hypothetical protein AUJ52_07165 [Elusimicrobia bacterium CG1_02_63_36]|nr:MAG: hypothetical protein AUJ52_07165 [Elusimicrobia bacterium CG1_02_63_36]PIP84708.1 MAG: hypothetical protein COR54_02665 [Elusimicrobia bacterium CG22_combo_CG10-13_8_21_14_all_63_91]PJB23172.1 MAG: hypothetical protein CO113_19025 [Elusimicrobia bacterium CG_4_9_14_3_um_filter_62_55]